MDAVAAIVYVTESDVVGVMSVDVLRMVLD